MDPNTPVPRSTSPFLWLGRLGSVGQAAVHGIRYMTNSTQVIDRDSAKFELETKLGTLTRAIMASNKTKQAFAELMRESLHNRVNKLLFVYTNGSRPLPDSMPFIEAIRLCYEKIFKTLQFAEDIPLVHVNNDPDMPEMTYWELLLQIRGRCLWIEKKYEERNAIGKLKDLLKLAREREELLMERYRAQRQMIGDIKIKMTTGDTEELRRELLAAQEEENSLRDNLRQEKGKISAYQREYEQKILELHERTQKDIEEKKLQILHLQERINTLTEENDQLKGKIQALYEKVDTLEEQLSRASKKTAASDTETVVEVQVGKDQSLLINQLKREIESLKSDNAFFEKEFAEIAALKERKQPLEVEEDRTEFDINAKKIEEIKDQFYKFIQKSNNRDEEVLTFLQNLEKTLEK